MTALPYMESGKSKLSGWSPTLLYAIQRCGFCGSPYKKIRFHWQLRNVNIESDAYLWAPGSVELHSYTAKEHAAMNIKLYASFWVASIPGARKDGLVAHASESPSYNYYYQLN